jgi:protein-arginine kinase activator protein McsA
MFGKRNKLSDEEVDRIAEAVVNKIILKQKEIDEAYFNNVPPALDQQKLTYEMILQNIIGLQILLSDYVKNEKYEEAEITKNKIAELRIILDKFGGK